MPVATYTEFKFPPKGKYRDYSENKIACPIWRKKDLGNRDREDYADFISKGIQFKQFVLKDPSCVKMCHEKITEFEKEIVELRSKKSELYFLIAKMGRKCPERGVLELESYQIDRDMEWYREEIKRFKAYSMISKKDDREQLNVELAKTAPISSFLIGQWQNHGTGRAVIQCPLHNEKTASFTWFKESNTYHCFGGCGKGGDNIDLFMKLNNCDFRHAVKELTKII